MELILVITAIFIGYIGMGWWSIWYRFERPVFMPFPIFRIFCSLGKKVSHSDFNNELDLERLKKFAFIDTRYRDWFNQTIKSGYITRMQFFVFNKQQLNEIDAELKKRGIDTDSETK